MGADRDQDVPGPDDPPRLDQTHRVAILDDGTLEKVSTFEPWSSEW
jgi:hypothetical protein